MAAGSVAADVPASVDLRYCSRRDFTPWYAVLGVFSYYKDAPQRTAIRSSWMSPNISDSGGILSRFVIRADESTEYVGRPDPSIEVLREHTEHRDILFVPAAANMSRALGPLRTLQLWMACAVSAFPYASLIGKADDDTWITLKDVSSHLRASASWLTAAHLHKVPPLMYWGMIETYSMNVSKGEPVHFKYKFGHRPKSCYQHGGNLSALVERGDLVGPFSFAKGPCFFASTPFVQQLVDSTEINAYIDRVLSIWTRPAYRLMPYEDVYMGFALSQVSVRLYELLHDVRLVGRAN
jgi:hypothetical protein